MNKLMLCFLIICLIISCSIASGEDFARYNTQGHLNGYYWVVMDDITKVAFIAGWVQGLLFGVTSYDLGEDGKLNPKSRNMLDYYIYKRGLESSDLISAINYFYEDPINRKIPISMAIMVLIQKSKGENIDKQVEFLRSQQ